MAFKKAINHLNASFLGIFTGLVIMLVLWVTTVAENSRLLDYVMSENQEAMLIQNMVHAMHNRTIALYRMTATEDAFEADHQMLIFMDLAEKFMKSRDKVLAGNFSAEEKKIWKDVIPDIKNSQEASREVLMLISNGYITKALIAMETNVKPSQDIVVDKLNRLIKYQNSSVETNFNHFNERSKLAYPFIAILTVTILIIAAMVMITLRKKHRVESLLIQQGERIRTLYEISAISGMSIDQQINETLNYGRTLLNTEMAKISCIDTHIGTNTITHIVAPEEMMQAIPTVQPLADTLCNIVYTTEKPLTLHHASESEYKDHPAYRKNNIETYAAVPIWVNEKIYGTICFANRTPREKPFLEVELDMINLIGRWISVSIERKNSQLVELEKQEAVTANRAKSEFLANMSHEIRTPLNAIIGFAEASLNMNTSKQELDNSLNIIVRSGHHLLQVINNILDLSKIESGNMEAEKLGCSVFEIINDVDALMRTRIEEKGLAFYTNYNFPLPAEIETDPVKLKQILINLCSNAIKFTETGQVKISVDYLPNQDKLKFTVIDSGIGLSKEQQSSIFKPFSQADISTTRKYGGTGLGLSLSRQLVTLLGGELTVKSETGVGSCFEFTIDTGKVDKSRVLNSSKALPKPVKQYDIQQPATLHGHVLVADDNSDNRQLMQLLLGQLGLKVSTAKHGQEVLEMINAGSDYFDIILMDMQMPVLDGYSTVEKLRQQDYQKPIIALTADAMLDSRERCLAIGCNDFLSKPVSQDKLTRVLKEYLDEEHHGSSRKTVIANLLAKDPEFVKLVNGFIDRLPNELEILKEDISSENWGQMQHHLHTLKGVSANLGFKNVADLIAEMEIGLKQADRTKLNAFIPKLQKAFNRIA